KNVIKLSQMILDDFGGEVPTNREDLVKLPGVGRKTANVVLNEAFGQPTMAVDTHIFRVANRTGMAPGKDVVEVELNLLRVTPDEHMMGAHHWVLLHGRYTCLARTPKCYDCRLADLCKYRPKTPPP
ncbi:MAG: endonuclease III, partial [Pseudomonadota bacterium]